MKSKLFFFTLLPGTIFVLLFFFNSCDLLSAKNKNSGSVEKTHQPDSLGYKIPQPKGWVNDFENIYSASEKKYLDSLLSAYEKNTTNEIAVITVDSTMVDENNFDDYIFNVAKNWKIGKVQKNNGSLIGISRQFQSIRIENGDGIAVKLSDEQTKNIIDSVFIENFKRGEFFEGTKEGILAMMKKINN
jgi:uncharacterized protein